MARHRTLRPLAVVLGVIGAAYALVVPAQTQRGNPSPRVQIGLHRGRYVADGEVLVKFRDQARFAYLGPEFDADRDEHIGDGAMRRVHSRSHRIDALIAMLSRLPEVEYVEPNYIVFALATPNDPYFSLLWGLRNTGQLIGGVAGKAGADISAATAWGVSTGSRANVIAVVDSGIDYTHPDLAANVWSAPGSFTVTVGGVTVSCAAGTHGFNAITRSCNPMDDYGHGTHVSGTIGAAGNNGVGVVGVNWTTSIMGLKFLNNQGLGSTSDAINAIEFAIQVKQKFGPSGGNVRVLSNSWGGGGLSQALLDVINKTNANEMLFVAAAGNAGTNNDTTPSYPSNYDAPNVIAVAATDNQDRLPSFSNYGATTVDLGAPGVNIASTYPGNRYAYMSGTSMAAPHVAGAAALVLAGCGGGLTTANVIDAILNSTDTVPALAGKTVTGGRLNAYRAITDCGAAPPPPPPVVPDFAISASPASATVRRGRSASYTITVTPSGGFTSNVTLSVSGVPRGAVATLSPTTVIGGSGTSRLSVATSLSTPRSTFTLLIMGSGGSKTRTASVTLKVNK